MDDYRLLLESVRDYGIFMLDKNGYVISWNQGAQQILKYSADEIIGKHFTVFYTEEDRQSDKAHREIQTAMDTGRYEEEGWRVKKDGTRFWANVIITPVYNENHEHIGFSKVNRDLTERRNMELALRDSEERFRSLVEQVKDYAIFMLDVNGNIVTWNEGARRIKGYTADEIIGKHFSIFYTEEDLKNEKPRWELEIVKQTGRYEEEGWRLKKDGSRFWANVLITAVFNEGRQLIGFSKLTRDLTEKKRTEEALKLSNLQYQQIAEELHRSNRELENANQSLEQFASVASHDLKEPLRKITMYTDRVISNSKDNLSESSKTHLQKVIDAAKRMERMIHDFLDFSTLSKKQPPECVSLQNIVQETIELLEHPIKEKNAVIKTDSLPEAVVIPSQFRQLFQNLISNALKFSKENLPPVINITHSYLSKTQVNNTEDIKPAKQYLQIKVQDNGIGFDAKDAGKIFGLFNRLHSPARYEGTGLGLSICKRVVENHGGILTAQSRVNEGATFTVTIPA